MQLYFNKNTLNLIMFLSLHYGNEKDKVFGISQLIKH